MERPALRPKPLPGDPGGAQESSGAAREPRKSRQHAGRRRGRRLVTALLGVTTGAVLVLSGVGLGAMGATVVGAGGLAELKRQTGTVPLAGPSASPPRDAPAAPSSAPAPVVARLGVEVADDRKPGARVVGVHIPGPGFSAGLVRGDVLLAFAGRRVDSAADLARAVARARPGDEVKLTVRRAGGGYRQLTAVPGIVT
ncbi:PDZ domain-containing protein [Streptomyces malachitofuscus]|nr:PDZ domain-containing protein [Streptomyces malachitofuscus]